MEIPIQLIFFKKLELYQVLKEENKKRKGTKRKTWDVEKRILIWTKEHHHLNSPITQSIVMDEILMPKREPGTLTEYSFAMENLVVRGFANIATEENITAIKITKEGLIMGSVINDIETESKNPWNKFKYPFFIWITWITIIAGIIILIYNAFSLFF